MQTEGHIYDQKFVHRKWSIGPRGAYFIFPITVALRQERFCEIISTTAKTLRGILRELRKWGACSSSGA